MKQFDLSVVIVSWNVCDLLNQCLSSLYANPPAGTMEVWVVDNASGDDSVTMLRETYPTVNVIENRENTGFAQANNQAFEQCSGRYILMLNPDTIVLPEALDRLIDWMDGHPACGAAGPSLLNADRTFQPSVFPFPTLGREVWRLFHMDRFYRVSQYDFGKWGTVETHEVDSIQGACLLLRSEALEQVGVLDPSYFMYTEETDLCFRLKRAEWQLNWLPEAEIIHLGGQSSRQVATRSFINLYQSKLQFIRKHYGGFQAALYRVILLVASLARLALVPLAWFEPVDKRKVHFSQANNYLELCKRIPGM